MTAEPDVIVYYNSACPVCEAGIARQKDQMAHCSVEWIDVHANPQAIDKLGVELEFVRERLHVRDAQGVVKVGATALAELWSQTPRQAWLGKLAHLPGLRLILIAAYNVFARLLYIWNRWRKHW